MSINKNHKYYIRIDLELKESSAFKLFNSNLLHGDPNPKRKRTVSN
jgi:hypothetical protein